MIEPETPPRGVALLLMREIYEAQYIVARLIYISYEWMNVSLYAKMPTPHDMIYI